MRRRAPIAVVALAVLLNLANTPAQERRSTLNPKPPSSADARELSARIDTLLIARQADSVQAIVARSLPDAFAEGDSALVSALLLARAQANQMGGRMREAREAFAAVREWAEGSRDSARWMDALGGGAYSAGVLGMRDESVALNTRLLEIALATDDLIREARARTGRAYVAMVGGDLASARAGYARSIRLYRMAGDGRAELVPLVGLGRVYSSLGQIDSARACFKRVWLSATEMGQQVEAAHALNNLGTLEHRYGDLMLAMQYYQTAFEIHRAQGETMGAMTAASNLALAHQACGRYDKAAEILQEQLAVCEDAGTRPQAGLVLKNLGFAYASARRIQSANATFRRAAAMGDTLDVQVRIDALWGLADALAVDSLDAAIEVLRTGIETIGQGDLTLDLKSRLTLARLLLDRQDGEDAIIEIRRALSASEGLPPDRMG
ncbi:MAG TPA: tetratricopeptide repeat protein, partial [Candidatus Krumholzibacteria bacterium]|nr:tetratricopeptide repeat protein [Candidatus Krumholzibacteria bacterium]